MQGCPWRCPFCHNAALQNPAADNSFVWEKFIDFLKSRRGILDGVVFSGGEPLMQDGLGAAIGQIKDMGYLAGLHTGGYNPKHLEKILPLVDWVGFDIKAPFKAEHYCRAVGGVDSLAKVEESLRLLLASGVDFECRTTCDPRLLSVDDIEEIAKSLQALGVKKYFLQKYRPIATDHVTTDEECEKFFVNQNLLNCLQRSFGEFAVRR